MKSILSDILPLIVVQVYEIGKSPDSQKLTEAPLEMALQPSGDRRFWIDLLDPTDSLVEEIESKLQIDIPTRLEMRHRGPGSRIYKTKGAQIFVVSVVAQAETQHPIRTQTTFVITDRILISLRYYDLLAFRTVHQSLETSHRPSQSTTEVFLFLMEQLIDRLADLLEGSASRLDSCNALLSTKSHDHQSFLKQIGHEGDITSKTRESLLSLSRTLVFVTTEPSFLPTDRTQADRLLKDTQTLVDDAAYQINQLTFVLDAALGMISISQNNTIRILSLVAVIFLPPTLLASLWGMNFEFMPELTKPWGYPLALLLMGLSSILPYYYSRWKKWL